MWSQASLTILSYENERIRGAMESGKRKSQVFSMIVLALFMLLVTAAGCSKAGEPLAPQTNRCAPIPPFHAGPPGFHAGFNRQSPRH